MTQRRFAAVAAILLMMAAASFAHPTGDPAWNEFLTWYKTYTGSPYPNELIKAYTAQLAASGKSQEEIRTVLEVLRKVSANAPTEMMRMHFNKVFTIHTDLFSHEPNALLVRTVRGLKPGRALDIAMGQGRNSVFLAKQGWDVTGYDFSDEALASACRGADEAGVRIKTVQSTHEQFEFGNQQWDLIVMTYALINMQDQALLGRIKNSLKPGGLILVEQPNSGGEGKGPANALFRSFEDMRVIYYEDTVDVAEWSKKPNRLGRIVVQKD